MSLKNEKKDATFDWSWWDNLLPKERNRREQGWVNKANHLSIKRIFKRLRENDGEFFDYE